MTVKEVAEKLGTCAPKDTADYSSVEIDDEDLDELVDDE